MPVLENPALKTFVEQLAEHTEFAQVRIARRRAGFELRHVTDAGADGDKLRPLNVPDLRALAQFTGRGEFRPLKSAPTLAAGWQCECHEAAELGRALDHLYPGAVADWFAAQQPAPPATSLRDYTRRQSGMYRLTAQLSDTGAASVVHAACDATRCLKRRLWAVPGLPSDTLADKSVIPCLEPCAPVLEALRKAARAEVDSQLERPASPAQT